MNINTTDWIPAIVPTLRYVLSGFGQPILNQYSVQQTIQQADTSVRFEGSLS